MLDVKRFANQLLNPDLPEVIRALNLYELQPCTDSDFLIR